MIRYSATFSKANLHDYPGPENVRREWILKKHVEIEVTPER